MSARHIAQARLLKATTLLSTLRSLPDFPGRDELDSWGEESWSILSVMAGVRVPSVNTRELVIRMATVGAP